MPRPRNRGSSPQLPPVNPMRFWPSAELVLGSTSRERYERCLLLAQRNNGVLTIQMIIEDAVIDTTSPFRDVVMRDTNTHVQHSRYVWVREMVGRIYIMTVGHITEKVRAMVSVQDGSLRVLKPTPDTVRMQQWVNEVTRRAATFERSWRTHRAKILALQARPPTENWWMPQPTPPAPRRRTR